MAESSQARTPGAILEELAVAVMGTDASDEAGVNKLIALFEELAKDGGSLAASAAALVARLRKDSVDIRALGAALDAASEEVARMQDALAVEQRAAAQPPPPPTSAPPKVKGAAAPADPDAFVLPEWGDEKTLSDFLAAQRSGLEELEGIILGMEKGDPERRAAFKRRLHTMKGEAGVLGLDDYERVCHATEDFIESEGASADATDRLLKIRDWMAKAIEGYAHMRLPTPRAPELVAQVFKAAAAPKAKVEAPAPAAIAPKPNPPKAEAKPAAPAKPAWMTWNAPYPNERVSRDEETIGLFGEFLSESGEGLNRVDQILMDVERDGVNADTVNSLFRVFHTIKGTAGFLELAEVIALAHQTETMLNKCRENTLTLEGPVIDAVFDSTTALREMLEGVRVALEAGTGFPRREGLESIIQKIQDVSEGNGASGEDAPTAAQEKPAAAAAISAAPPTPAPTPTPVVTPVEAPIAVAPPPPVMTSPEATAKVPERAEPVERASSEEESKAAAHPGAPHLQPRAAEAEPPVKLKETIKVDLERVDSLVEMIGELVVVESMVVNAPEISKASSVRVRNCLSQLAKVTRDLQDVGMRMRMVPVAGVFQKMARMVRDLSRRSGKQVSLVTSGETTEMDRSMVEQIADPLVHMIRNACDHGVEPSEERVKAGKPPVGQVRLSAYHEGGSVVIEIDDDGRGLNKAAIIKKAIERGLITSADGMSEEEIHGLIFVPGFSTAEQVTEISGRGVGMDVVKRNIDAMRGRVVISSTPGSGTKFKLVLPLTLAIIDGMLVACGSERYIIPTLSIVESIQPDSKMLVSFAQKNEMINLRGEILPLLRLDRLFELKGAKTDPTQALVVVVEAMNRRMGLLVDEVVTQQQVVIKTLGEGMGRARFLSGAAILSDGRVGLILNIDAMAGLVHKSVDYFLGQSDEMAQPATPGAQEVQA